MLPKYLFTPYVSNSHNYCIVNKNVMKWKIKLSRSSNCLEFESQYINKQIISTRKIVNLNLL